MTSCGSFAVTTFTSRRCQRIFISRIRSIMASFKDICPFAPAIPPSSVNPVRRPPWRLFLSAELKNQILQNMKYLSPQKFSWGDAPPADH